MRYQEELYILAEQPEAYIGICGCCNTIHMAFGNLAFNFTQPEFEYFYKYIKDLDLDQFSLQSQTGKSVFMKSPCANIIFCFTKPEISFMLDLMNEATVMLSVERF